MNVLTVPGKNGQDIIDSLGLEVSYQKGAALASKRLSRLFRPYRYGRELPAAELRIREETSLNQAVWDGAFRISRALVTRCDQYLDGLENRRQRRFRRELATGRRWELTIVTDAGQYKGHALVSELPDDVDVLCPPGVARRELRLKNGQAFVGLNPVHASDVMRLDIQSLINLLPFFGESRLMTWLSEHVNWTLSQLAAGSGLGTENVLYGLTSAEAIDRLETDWPAGAYIASGGNVRWFAGAMKSIARTYRERLLSQETHMRFPVPGGRYYILPASIGNRTVARGHCELVYEDGTCYVNDLDWQQWIVQRLGGADGDDALWVFTFTDYDQQRKVLVWRSPNQYGEYALLKPEGEHAPRWIDGSAWPMLDSRLLPPPTEAQEHIYGSIRPLSQPEALSDGYNLKALYLSTCQAIRNLGILGQYCNCLMLSVALTGGVPRELPATLETVIDFSVKEIGDLEPVKVWIDHTLMQLSMLPCPAVLQDRLGQWQSKAHGTDDHPIARLQRHLAEEIARFATEVQKLAAQCMPPAFLFELGAETLNQGMLIRRAYGQYLRQVSNPTKAHFDGAVLRVEKLVEAAVAGGLSRESVIYGVIAAVYTHAGERDGVIWHGLGKALLEALRLAGLIGWIEWDGQRASLIYAVSPEKTEQPIWVDIRAVWYNLWMHHTGKQGKMSSVPKREAKLWKAMAGDLLDRSRGAVLQVQPSDALPGRAAVIEPGGRVIGLLDRSLPPGNYRLLTGVEHDGNIRGVLCPLN